MHAAHEVNGPRYAHAILATKELLALLPATQERKQTIKKVEIERFSVISSKPFEAVVAALRVAVGRPDMVEFAKATKGARNFTEPESVVQRGLGWTGLMMFMELDHGAILRK